MPVRSLRPPCDLTRQHGRGVESSFGSPNAITVGPDGHLYFNHGDDAASFPTTIRRIRFDPT